MPYDVVFLPHCLRNVNNLPRYRKVQVNERRLLRKDGVGGLESGRRERPAGVGNNLWYRCKYVITADRRIVIVQTCVQYNSLVIV
jgi:hypothetical protein